MRFIKKKFLKLVENKSIIERYIFFTNLTILGLILLVPLWSYLITRNTLFLNPLHFALSAFIGLVQITLINQLFKREITGFFKSFAENLEIIFTKIGLIRTLSDVRKVRHTKEVLLKKFQREPYFRHFIRKINALIDEILDVISLKVTKDEFLRRLTSTLNLQKLGRIFTKNLVRSFQPPAVALYLKDSGGENYILVSNEGFANLQEVLGEGFVNKARDMGAFFYIELPHELDYGVLKLKSRKLFVVKLQPRENQIIGFIFVGITSEYEQKLERLKKFLREVYTPLCLLFENALEHEKSLMYAKVDPLTGVFNRGEGVKRLKIMFRKAEDSGHNLCILVIDIDNFKKINDTYGHDVGDIVLKEVAKTIKNSVRDNDLVMRWGGEEFLVAVPNLPPDKVYDVAERIRRNIANLKIKLANVEIHPTVSIGVACTDTEKTYSPDELFKRADERLYQAKKSGKNKVVAP